MFYLFRVEVLMPDGAWLSFLMTSPTKENISLMVSLAYPEAKSVKVKQVDPP